VLIKITLHSGILQRIGAVALIVGGILIFPNVLFPRPDDPSDHTRFLSLLVVNISQTKGVMLAVPLGLWVFTNCMEAIYQSIANICPGSWSSLRRSQSYTRYRNDPFSCHHLCPLLWHDNYLVNLGLDQIRYANEQSVR
jgi:hypothetical protein